MTASVPSPPAKTSSPAPPTMLSLPGPPSWMSSPFSPNSEVAAKLSVDPRNVSPPLPPRSWSGTKPTGAPGPAINVSTAGPPCRMSPPWPPFRIAGVKASTVSWSLRFRPDRTSEVTPAASQRTRCASRAAQSGSEVEISDASSDTRKNEPTRSTVMSFTSASAPEAVSVPPATVTAEAPAPTGASTPIAQASPVAIAVRPSSALAIMASRPRRFRPGLFGATLAAQPGAVNSARARCGRTS